MTVSDFALSNAAQGQRVPVPVVTASPYIVGDDSESSGSGHQNLSAFWHSFRRHWVSIILIGGALAAALACAAWYGMGDTYSATATLLVTSRNNGILPGTNTMEGTDFSIYKKTQRQLITGQKVLASVLQRDAVGKLLIVREQVDQVGWLQKSLTVTYPDDAEIMLISFRCSDRTAAQIITKEIVAVYMSEVVDADHQKSQERPGALEKALQDIDATLTTKSEFIRNLADTLGTGDSEALTLAQKNTLDDYAMLLSQLRQVDIELIRKEREFKLATAQSTSSEVEGPGEADQEAMWRVILEADAVYSHLAKSKEALGDQRAHTIRTLEPGPAKPFLEQIAKEEEELDRKLAARESLLRLSPDGSEVSRRATAALEIQLLKDEKDRWESEVKAHRKAAEKFGRSSVEMDLLKAEVASISDLRRQIQSEFHAAKLEANDADKRVSVIGDVLAPRAPDIFKKTSASVAAGFAGMALWAALIMLWDSRKGRLNASDQLTRQLGMPVVGSLPLVRSSRGRLLHTDHLAESIDAVAANIFCQSPESPIHTILITSAVPGEGKTTLAANLAKSLASAGKSTLLIDFDLRRPALHRLFGHTVEGGVSEVLNGEAQAADVIRTTDTEGLSFISAGDLRLTSFSHLTNDGIRQFFDALRGQFDFIIVDAAPVLPVVDTRLIARQVDAVLLSILRDRSEISKVAAARSMLETFGARILGVVMTGSSSDVYYQRYQPIINN